MNERIRELAVQAGFYANPDVEKFEKFAELIMKECIDIIDPKTGTKWIKDQTQEEFWKNQSVHLIKEHFGLDGMSTEDKKTLIKELLGVKND